MVTPKLGSVILTTPKLGSFKTHNWVMMHWHIKRDSSDFKSDLFARSDFKSDPASSHFKCDLLPAHQMRLTICSLFARILNPTNTHIGGGIKIPAASKSKTVSLAMRETFSLNKNLQASIAPAMLKFERNTGHRNDWPREYAGRA